MRPGELLLSQKAALVAYHLALGEGLRTFQVAEMIGLSRQQAWVLLSHMSQCIPIYMDHGVWLMLDGTEEVNSSETD